MKLRYDNVSRTTLNTQGVDIQLPPWGKTDELEYLDSSIASHVNKFGVYYFYIVDALVKRGYVRDSSIFGAPYDFRKGPSKKLNFILNTLLLNVDRCLKHTYLSLNIE